MGRVHDAIANAKKWLLEQKRGPAWGSYVYNESPLSTVLSLYVLDGKRKTNAIDYLMTKRIWGENLNIGALLFLALKETGEEELAEKVLHELKKELREKLPNKGENEAKFQYEVEKILKNVKLEQPFGIGEREIIRFPIPIYTTLFKLTPEKLWYSRTSFFFNIFPDIALFIASKNNKKSNKKIINVIKKSLNEDDSHSSFTIPTVKCVYVLRMLGEDSLVKKSLNWIDKIINNNGSLSYFSSEDVYESCLSCLALINLGEDVTDTLKWLDSKNVGPGYPFISGSYVPDYDDSPMVVLIKKLTDNLDEKAYDTLDFILESQKSDGGWHTYAYYTRRLDISLKVFSLFINALGFFFIKSRRLGYGPLMRIRTPRIYRSFVDMSARTLITLSYFKEEKRVKKAIAKGCRYLLKQYSNGKFQDVKTLSSIGPPLRWVDSDFYETALALVALFKNGYKTVETDSAIKWMLNQKIGSPENAAYALWALVEGDYPKEFADRMVDIIISKQLPDGSWKPHVGVSTSERLTGRYMVGGENILTLSDPIHSHAVPLYALGLYKNRYE